MPRGSKLTGEEREIHKIAAAIHSSRGLTQIDIAKTLDISQSEVSRLLQEATDDQLLIRRPSFSESSADERLLRSARQRFVERNVFQEWLDTAKPKGIHRLNGLEVFSTKPQEACREAAKHVEGLLRSSHLTGIMFGQSIKSMVQEIKQLQPEELPSFRCIPVCGDPVFLTNQWQFEFSASWLAGSVEKAFVGKRDQDLPTLAGVPAYVHFGSETAAVAKWVRAIPGFKRIFGAEGLIHDVDCILTSVGVVNPESPNVETRQGAFLRERELQGAATEEELHERTFGEIGGILLHRPRYKSFSNKLNDGWMGLTVDHLREVARKARPEGSPGNIVVALGRHKADMVREVIRAGLANEIIASRDVVESLTGTAKEEQPTG